MLLVKTKLKESKKHGIGLFADQFIKKGTITWKYTPEYDVCYSDAQIKKMPKRVRERFFDFSYFDDKQKKYILCFDDQRFINHSSNPNIKSKPNFDTAKRDIKIGEEMTCNYEDYEKDWFKNRGLSRLSFES